MEGRPMGSPISWTDPSALLVADTSTVISLNATGFAQRIIRALPNRLVVVDAVPAELEPGRRRGCRDADLLNELVAAGLVGIVGLGELGMTSFEELVVGPAIATLDDGEAATIAYASEHAGVALIDEAKATRICAARFPTLRVGCTVDIFAHPKVQQDLGSASVAEAVFNALFQGRMRVFPEHMEWVVGLIGPDRAAKCSSLPNSVRPPHLTSAEEP
jgi:predicted nucleic acid-binding protein